jgi:hypothetical protein
LHKRHATVHTATIDVKIMRVDKKQVTMGLFRQLDEESIFNPDGTLRGTPWGRVNYCWSDNKIGTAFHVVWQDGEHLKRSAVPYRPGRDRRIDWSDFVYPPRPTRLYVPQDERARYEEELRDWGDSYDASPSDFWQRVEEMGQLDQLFIAV